MRLLPMLRKGITGVTATTALIALGPGVAHAAAWLSPIPLNSSSGSSPSVAVDATGNTIAAWQTNPSPNIVQGAFHVFGATGFKQLPDFANDSTTPLDNTEPVIVTNRSGNGLVVWIHDAGLSTTQVDYRTISPGGIVGTTVQTLTPVAMVGFTNPVAAINDSGAAIVAWQQNGSTIEAASRASLGGAFLPSTPATLDTNGTGGPASVAINNSGRVMAMWPSTVPAGALAYKTAPAGGAWDALPSAVSKGGHIYSDQSLAANANGQLVLAFQDKTVQTVVSEASGTLSPGGFGMTPTINTLSGTGISHGPSATVADSGAAIIGWTIGTNVQFSRRPAGGAFPGPAGAQSITPVPAIPDNFTLAGDNRGDVIAAWYGFEMGGIMHNVVRAAVKPAGSNAFSASQIISSKTNDSVQPVVTLDRNGDGVVGMQLGNSPAGISVAVYDASPPQLGKPSGPTTLKAGSTASLSVSAVDGFSPPPTVSWSFGDGSAAASGTHVSHKFDNVGRFTVKVTATDRAGNSSSATLIVNVTAPPNRCVVPRLKGKTLSQAKTALKKAHCKLGKVHKPKKPKHRKLRKLVVKSSSPGAGKIRPAGTKVTLTLAEVPKKKHK
jgi:hypothetical protein